MKPGDHVEVRCPVRPLGEETEDKPLRRGEIVGGPFKDSLDREWVVVEFEDNHQVTAMWLTWETL